MDHTPIAIGTRTHWVSPEEKLVLLAPEDRAQHLYIAGKTGLGKSTLPRGVSVRAAAMKLDTWFELGLGGEAPAEKLTPAPSASAPTPAPGAAESLPITNPPLTFTLKTLDPHHASLSALGLKAQTIELFGAGYCTKGLLKGRLAIPIHNGEGELVAYAGLAVEAGETPRYLFPPKFNPALEVMNLHRLPEFAGEDSTLYLVPEIEGVLQLSDSGVSPVLGLFDGSLSRKQEEAIAGAHTLFERLVLVGESFEGCTVARLARHAAVRWMPGLQDVFSERMAATVEGGE